MKKILLVLFIFTAAACDLTAHGTNLPSPAATQMLPTVTHPAPTYISASATPIPATATAYLSPTPEVLQNWWEEAVFYEIFVRSFYDSNGDGIGDLNGVIEKLDYLNDGNLDTTSDLGISAIWLMPIFPSPSTHGYDVTDFYSVNPQYGTLEDLQRLVKEAHRRGIHIILDLPLNHTSNQHPWFIQSQDVRSTYRGWYTWEEADPGWKGPWNQQVWYPIHGGYYYAFFWEGMPDLNYRNPFVTEEMEKVTRFWLEDVGIDGFRLDAIGSLIEEGQATIETQASHDWFGRYFNFYKALNPEAMTIGEIWREDAVVVPWVANRQVDLAFEFDLAFAMLGSLNDGNTSRLLETLRSGTSQFPTGQYGTFLTNHDMARVMTQLGGNLEKAKAAASLYLSLPGVPFVYYGEEIGMVGEAPDEMGRRPMQWADGQYAGFSEAIPWIMPDSRDPVINVSAQAGDPSSLLSHYRKLISLRNSHTALRTGKFSLFRTSNPGVFACLRSTPDEAVLILVNLTTSTLQNIQISLGSSSLKLGDYAPVSLLDTTPLAPLPVLQNGRIQEYVPVPEIPPYGTLMMWVQNR